MDFVSFHFSWREHFYFIVVGLDLIANLAGDFDKDFTSRRFIEQGDDLVLLRFSALSFVALRFVL